MFFAQNAQKFLWNDAAAISIAGFGCDYKLFLPVNIVTLFAARRGQQKDIAKKYFAVH